MQRSAYRSTPPDVAPPLILRNLRLDDQGHSPRATGTASDRTPIAAKESPDGPGKPSYQEPSRKLTAHGRGAGHSKPGTSTACQTGIKGQHGEFRNRRPACGGEQRERTGLTMITADSIWSVVQTHAPRERWVSSREIFALVELHAHLEVEDRQPRHPGLRVPAWKQLLREVLRTHVRQGEIRSRNKSTQTRHAD